MRARYGIALMVQNGGASACKISVWDAYSARRITSVLRTGEKFARPWPLERSFGWYDLSVEVDADPGFLCSGTRCSARTPRRR